MKKFISAVLGATVFTTSLFSGMSVSAEENIDILCLEKDGNIISINATNSLPVDTLVTLTVTRDDAGDSVSEQIWHYDQKKVASGEMTVFSFIIPDKKNEISGTGKYVVSVQNTNRDKDTEVLYYATDEDTKSFVVSLKEAARSVENEEIAYEKFIPLMTEENAGVIMELGIDYNVFSVASDEVQKDTLNLFYKSDIEKMTDKEISNAFSAAFGLAIYNSGEKDEGLSLSNQTYGGKPMDDEKYNSVIAKLEDKYSSVSEFSKDIDVAYGLVVISEAKVGTVGDALSDFFDETGECSEIINKLSKLSPTKQKTAYEYVVKTVDEDINTIKELEEILENAYDEASDSGKQSGSGSGSGGGASGSSSNRVQSGGGSVSVAQGSAIPDERVEEKDDVLFIDVEIEHWAYDAVYALKNIGIVNGNENGMYEPDRAITREEFTKMLVAACDINSEGGTADFIDMEENAWYIPYIGAAVDNGIVNGIGDNKFGVGENITRQDMSVMVERAVSFRKIALEEVREYISFEDEEIISEYAVDSVKSLYTAGVVNGKGENMFDPLGNATRAEAAKIIYEAFKGGI